MNLVTSKGHCHFPRERSVLRGTKAGCAIEISHHFKSVDMCSTRPDPGIRALARQRSHHFQPGSSDGPGPSLLRGDLQLIDIFHAILNQSAASMMEKQCEGVVGGNIRLPQDIGPGKDPLCGTFVQNQAGFHIAGDRHDVVAAVIAWQAECPEIKVDACEEFRFCDFKL
jgi:hypothetical protein